MTVMTEPSPVVDEFSQVEQRIQSLTTLISNLDRRRHKTPNDPYTPPILQSIATLLTCEQKAAVTGTITSTDADILIATDATPLDSDSGIGVGIEPVHFDTVPFRTTLDDSRGYDTNYLKHTCSVNRVQQPFSRQSEAYLDGARSHGLLKAGASVSTKSLHPRPWFPSVHRAVLHARNSFLDS